MKQLRILVFSAAFGNGHLRAAEAVIEGIRIKEPLAIVTHLDFGDFLSKRFNSVVKKLYFELVKHSPKLWGKFYYQTSKLQPNSRIQRFLNQLGRTDFLQYIQEFEPDLIVCTYPTISSILAQLRLEHILQVPVITVITDYTVHSHWVNPGVDRYIVACEEVKEMLVTGGILARRIDVTGIPVSPKFEVKIDPKPIVSELGLKPDLLTFLVMGAHGSLESTKKICMKLANSLVPVQLIIVCGNNRKLYHSLQEVIASARNPLARLRYVDNLEDLMSVSDLIITKAGGLTVTEALTRHLPLVIFKPIPGQEEENAHFLQRIGAGNIADTEEKLEELLEFFLSYPKEIKKMREKAAAALPGHSAERAVEKMLELMTNLRADQKTG
ncbi:diglucosyldiacylglycerol synthase (LTA membrane anchor synthesis) [Desulfosporosinus sp. I2]|uniref:UDP-N-acetylglucosamine--LPS N-acetylglucosamine transferase n=1 Tax=Desulfosporosinus sp. I2 TaxID=1617025 RepID=UPI0005ED53FB|nr:UDP-N-acetylglucosamine--LPS N-acetylglucosamine transferase [Desulfosporosinus sp. I2]KJR46725.1 diglucosyldiacylglycerol synthase (LTA membrane anchor synthesis) [Desulfosporosinus sp. I2]